ncbi:MAG: hypothetical protein DWQ05_04650 [Calditrichaeota bacterium]|nr:MAG: hypothetical protein DWQ05_04650 [Calditrichota bacterium]
MATNLSIHKIVRISLFDARQADIDLFINRYGAIMDPDSSETAELKIQFVDEFATEELDYLGINSVAFNAEGFYLLCQHNGFPIARIPMAQLGESCEIVYRRGAGYPLLTEIIKLMFLKSKYVPLHASAFNFQGKNILNLAWAKGGKTSNLLAFLKAGAFYIGDEWLMLSADGKKLLGIPYPLEISDWQLKYVPELKRYLSTSKKILFDTIHFLTWCAKLLRKVNSSKFLFVQLINHIDLKAQKLLKFKIQPQEVFRAQLNSPIVKVDKVFFTMSHNKQDIQITETKSTDIVQKMVAANGYELIGLIEYYRAFKFAFPYLSNPLIERYDELQTDLLSAALKGFPCYIVKHPYPCSLDQLYEHMHLYCLREFKRIQK